MEKSMANNDGEIHSLATFQLGDLPKGYIALLLAYATSQEKLSSGELESFVIGMSRDQAKRLGETLLKHAAAPPSGRSPPRSN
jgi:hypothetical protein